MLAFTNTSDMNVSIYDQFFNLKKIVNKIAIIQEFQPKGITINDKKVTNTTRARGVYSTWLNNDIQSKRITDRKCNVAWLLMAWKDTIMKVTQNSTLWHYSDYKCTYRFKYRRHNSLYGEYFFACCFRFLVKHYLLKRDHSFCFCLFFSVFFLSLWKMKSNAGGRMIESS
jgi:hypothetical protein